MSAHLPDIKSVRDIVEGMLGRTVAVDPNTPRVDRPDGTLVGGYVNRGNMLCALIALDVPAAASFGAALALMPPSAALAAVEANELSEELADNAGEVLNVLASAFNVDGAPHMRLAFTYLPGAPIPQEVAAWMAAYVSRIDLSVVPAGGFPEGRLAVIVLP